MVARSLTVAGAGGMVQGREREEEACLATVASLVLAWRSATLFGEDRVKRLVLLCLLESFGLRPRLPSIL